MAFLWCETCAIETPYAGHIEVGKPGPCCGACHRPTFRIPDLMRLKIQADVIAHQEAGVYGRGKPTDIYPDWVYEARTAIRHQNEKLPWLDDLLRVLGWQGGTIHAALNAVSRLVAAEDERRKRAALSCPAPLVGEPSPANYASAKANG